MRKWIIGIVVIVIISVGTWLYRSNKLADNYVREIKGYYKHSEVLDVFEYQEERIFMVRNYETSNEGWDGDYCIDDMLMISILNKDDELLETIQIPETLTLDNDGLGIRFGEIHVDTTQVDSTLYASISVYDTTYILEFDISERSYELYEVPYFLSDIRYNQAKLEGLHLQSDEDYTTLYFVTYNIDDLSENRVEIGSLMTQSDYPVNRWEVALFEEYVVMNGNVENGQYSYDTMSVYNLDTKETSIIHDEDVYYYSFWESDHTVYYAALYKDHTSREIFTIDGTKYDISGLTLDDKETLGETVSSSYIHMSTDDDFYNNKIRLYDIVNEKEIVLEYDSSTYLKAIYETEEQVYLLVDSRQNIISQIINGSNELWLISYPKESFQ